MIKTNNCKSMTLWGEYVMAEEQGQLLLNFANFVISGISWLVKSFAIIYFCEGVY